MSIRHDLHVHSTYSDGWDLAEMADAARSLGVNGLGAADHCPVGPDTFERRARYDLVETFEARREELATLNEQMGIRLYDAAEVTYDPRKEDRIRAFLEEAAFEYTIGSIHYVTDHDVVRPSLEDPSAEEKRRIVEEYMDWQVALIESELFDIVGHLDLPQRSPVLRGVMTEDDYRRIAMALAESRTVPELNGGRLDRAYGTVHPHPDALSIFAEEDVSFVAGSDAHSPDQLRERLSGLSALLEDIPVDYVAVPPALAPELSCSR